MTYPFPFLRAPVICSFTVLAALAGAQSAAPAPVATQGLPADLLMVPGGKVTMGIDANGLVELAKSLTKNTAEQDKIISTSLTELGEAVIDVEGFYMSKYPVTNEQYKVFVEKTGHRFPYHWWADGRKDDFSSKERVQAISEMQTNIDKKVAYWEDNWKKLPWAIPAGTEKHPVTYVSWADAMRYAVWAGMRLPVEAEWTRAAIGELKPKSYLLGDKWDASWLEALRLKDAKDRRGTKAVGTTAQVATGPYGHGDLVANVWEWMFDASGYSVRAPRKSFDKEFDKLKKLHPGDMIVEEKVGHRLLKGGSYLSFASPNQLRLGVRSHAADAETFPAVGFRLAKSMQPGRDMVRARIRVEYDFSAFGNRRPLIEDQVGAERYELNDKGFVAGYHAVSLVPISDIGVSEKNPETKGKDLDEISRETPLIIGTFMTTDKLAAPALEPGIYTVYYRAKGAAQELVNAIRLGHRELKTAKAEEKKDDKKKPAEAAKDDKKGEGAKADKKAEGDWRKIVLKYGISEEWVAKHGGGKIDKLALKDGNYEIPLDAPLYLFKNDNDQSGSNRFVAHLPADDGAGTSKPTYKGAKVVQSKDGTGRHAFNFEYGVKNEAGRHLGFALSVVLDAAPQATETWRLSSSGPVAAASSSSAPASAANGATGGAQKVQGK